MKFPIQKDVLFGDSNVNLKHCNNHNSTNVKLDQLTSNQSSRHTSHYKTIIDNSFSNAILISAHITATISDYLLQFLGSQNTFLRIFIT